MIKHLHMAMINTKKYQKHLHIHPSFMCSETDLVSINIWTLNLHLSVFTSCAIFSSLFAQRQDEG